jgi:Rrf2 family protein
VLTQKSRYAIKALMALAQKKVDTPYLRIVEISEKAHIPKKFLEAILLDLRNRGYLGSRIGVNGGYYLTKKPEEITLSEIIRYTSGPIALIPCASLNYYHPCDDCDNEAICGLRSVATEVRDATLAILNNKTIADLISMESVKTKKI